MTESRRDKNSGEIQEASRVVFVDTLDDFCHIERVMARFVDWLSLDEQSFKNAYIQLCIPKLISLFIRLEMIDWNPLEVRRRITLNFCNFLSVICKHFFYMEGR